MSTHDAPVYPFHRHWKQNRSTWVKPTIPASPPHVADDDFSVERLASGNLTGGGGSGGYRGDGGGTVGDVLPASVVETTATGVAAGAIASETGEGEAAEPCSSAGAIRLRESEEEDTVDARRGDERTGSAADPTTAAAAATTPAAEEQEEATTSRSWKSTPTEIIGHGQDGPHPLGGVDEGVTATGAKEGETAKERYNLCLTTGESIMVPSLARPRSSGGEDLEEPTDGGLSPTRATGNTRPLAVDRKEGGHISLVFGDGGTSSLPAPRAPPSSSPLLLSSGERAADTPSTQQRHHHQRPVENILGSREVEGVHVGRTESSKPPIYSSAKTSSGTLTLLRDPGEEVGVVLAVEKFYGEGSRISGSVHHRPHSGKEEEEERQGTNAYREEAPVRHLASRGGPLTADESSPRSKEARECSASSPALYPSSPPATVDNATDTSTLPRKRNDDDDDDHSGVVVFVDPRIETATPAAPAATTVPARSTGFVEETMATPATVEVPATTAVDAAAASRPLPSLSQEETMKAMAALIAKVRPAPPPSVEVEPPSTNSLTPATGAVLAGAAPVAGSDVVQDVGEGSRVDRGCRRAAGPTTTSDEDRDIQISPEDQASLDMAGREAAVAMVEGEDGDGAAGTGVQGEAWDTPGGMYEDDFEED